MGDGSLSLNLVRRAERKSFGQDAASRVDNGRGRAAAGCLNVVRLVRVKLLTAPLCTILLSFALASAAWRESPGQHDERIDRADWLLVPLA